MRFHPILLWTLLALSGLQAVPVPEAAAEIVTFQEDFTSWRWRDPDLTTAHWDTLEGRLHLFPVGLDSLGLAAVPGVAYASALLDTLMLVADGTDALLSFGVGDPAHATPLDVFGTVDGARDVVTDGGWAFVSVGNLGVQTVNIGDPADLVPGGQLDLPGFAYGLVRQGDRLYVAQSGSGVAVVDISVPWSPSLVTSVPGGNWARDVALGEQVLLVADSEAGLTVMSLAQPDQPQIIGSLATAASCWAVSAWQDRAFLALGTGGMTVVDLSDPADPQQLGSLTFPGNANCRSVTAVGDTLYAAVNDRGLYVLDVTDPSDPVIIGSHDTPGTAYHVSVSGTVSWLSDGVGGMRAFELNPWALDEERNLAHSLNLAPTGEPVARARVQATVTDSVRIDLTVDGGLNWLRAEPGGDWVEFAEPGEEFSWRAVLVRTDPTSDPALAQLDLTYEKLHGYGGINSITDVPDDTGGQVRLVWSPSRFDTPAAEYQVTDYSIYRRYEAGEALTPAASLDGGVEPPYPPGSWDYVTTVPADMEDTYAAVVPTLRDSTITQGMAWSVFFVRTRTATPGVFFDSPPDSGYSVNNLQPAPPTGFVVDRSPADGTALSWDASGLADFAHFRLYRAADSSTPPLPGTLFQVTTDTEYFDGDAGTWHYHLTQVNLAGQESEPAQALSPVPAGPRPLLLHPNVPNPFNPVTRISWEVPAGGARIRLDIFDTRGRLIRRLVDEFLAEGPHLRSWDGRDQAGRSVPSGVYHARIRTSGQDLTRKMLLLR